MNPLIRMKGQYCTRCGKMQKESAPLETVHNINAVMGYGVYFSPVEAHKAMLATTGVNSFMRGSNQTTFPSEAPAVQNKN